MSNTIVPAFNHTTKHFKGAESLTESLTLNFQGSSILTPPPSPFFWTCFPPAFA